MRTERSTRLPNSRSRPGVRIRGRGQAERGSEFRIVVASHVVRHRAAQDTSESRDCTQSFCARRTSSSFPRVAVLFVALGGALGTVLRYAANLFCAARFGADFPYATFAVNAIGSCALGFFSQFLGEKALLGVPLALAVGTGVLGGFTTYSSFNLETLRMLQAGQVGRALVYASLTFVTCLALGALGFVVGARLMR
jgi:CrcB protein